MRTLNTIIFLVLTVCLQGQITYDRWGDIVPFSLSGNYKNIIDLKNIHSVVLPSYDNDSIFLSANHGKTRQEVGTAFAAGFDIDTSINVIENAKHFLLEEGNLWIFVIESKTAEAIVPVIDKFVIPDGAYLSFITTDFQGHDPVTITNELAQSKVYQAEEFFSAFINGERAVIEYYSPKGVESIPDITLRQIKYFYAGPIRKKSALKTGIHGQTKLTCQFDVFCDSVAGWEEESNSIVYISIPFSYGGEDYLSTGTGFFVNKENNYDSDDSPYFVSCGHLFYPEIDSINKIHIDISSSYYPSLIQVFVDYLNPECNSLEWVGGSTIGGVELLLLGPGYNNPSFGSSNDYSFWQTNRNVNRLSKKSIEYSAWTYNHNYNYSLGYTSLGHPKRDAMKVITTNDRAYWGIGNSFFGVYFSTGICEEGFSGAPVFNSDKMVVGWITTGPTNPTCDSVGLYQSTAGLLSDLYPAIQQYIAPNSSLYALADMPEFEEADHCDNCELDGDETGLDCGGSCNPCNLSDFLSIKSDFDLIDTTLAKSRHLLVVEPESSGDLFQLASNYAFTAGNQVSIEGEVVIPASDKDILFNVDNTLNEGGYPVCEHYCIHIGNVFSPNGDGIGEYLQMNQAFIEEYSVRVLYYGGEKVELVYQSDVIPVHGNGYSNLWDGTGANYIYPYAVEVTYKDCYGNTHEETEFSVYCFY
jgi:hypothetical protein